ncbi:tumor necrosis factor receptor superfamily member 6 [Leptodactylus fuscus]|uniref:tumor necrosis factor receptor superfamily member 6 n=1 Tax=Leptodactylus fuscus TaxID=238119 RepID=UPI003F4ED21B
MKLRCVVVPLVLLQDLLVLARVIDHNTTEQQVNQNISNIISHKLMKRDSPCLEQEYHTGKHCCKFCRAGTHVQTDCTEEHGNPTCKDCIDNISYTDKNNGLPTCHKCLHCDAELGQEEEHACTVLHNTVCKCSKDFVCKENGTVESDGCKKCDHCTKCQYYARECTPTKDAVCRSPRHRYLIAASVGVSILFLCSLCCIKRKDDFIRVINDSVNPIPGDDGGSPTDELKCPEELKDIVLTEDLLQRFSTKMDLQTATTVVRSMGLSDVRIENIKDNHVNHSEEKTYYMLKEWHQSYGGNKPFPKLLETLQELNKNQIIKDLIQIARNHGQPSQS